MKPVIAIILVFLLVASLVAAEPEPSFGFRVTHWLSETFGGLFSIGSSWQSYVRWNPQLSQCWYYTAICSSSNGVVVDSSYCSFRTYTNEPKTIASVDQALLQASYNPDCTKKTGATGAGEIGDACTVSSDCGQACKGYPSGYSPRCIDGGNGRVCFCGQDTGYYAGICAADSDCETGEECLSGLCTDSNPGSGNPGPVDETTICDILNCDTKCADGTPVGECSTTKPQYCQALDVKHDTASLIAWSGICGCPEGQRPDFSARTCCTFPNCIDCNAGEYQTKTCPDGSEIIIGRCADGKWNHNEQQICPVEKPGTNWGLIFLFGGGAVILLLLLVGGILFISGKRRK